jgi:nucleotide-binding universal stress UspA family protein
MLNILVPIDFSATAKKAVKYAVYSAQKTGATVVILHVYQIPIASPSNPYVPSPERVQENIRWAEEQLKNLDTEIEGLKDISYGTKTLPMYWQIEFPEIIQQQNADLIIMGTNGASGLKELIMGSNTASVIDNAKCPVLAIPLDAPCATIERLGFAYDKEFVENLTTLDFLVWFTKRFSTLLDVFHVKGSEQDSDSAEMRINAHHLKQYLSEIQHSYSEIVGDNIEEGINRYSLEMNIDVLAMMHRSRSLFERLFRRSYSKKMAYHTSIPLLVIPERD